MQNFDLYLPTHLIFGKDRIEELPAILKKFGKNVLFTYGGGSIKKIGLYDKIKSLVADFKVQELSGIEPNPKIESVRKGVKICKEQGIDVILAVGGGSVIDASKNIACGAFYDGDPWDLVLDCSKVGRCVPIVSVLTLSATGSEYDGSAVISNPATNEKLPLFGNFHPKVSFTDPSYTFTVSARQTAAGSIDIMSHTFEGYFVSKSNPISDGFCETILKTVIDNAPIAIKDPNNYEARANLMLASSFACSGLLSVGNQPSPWPVHGMEHEISAYTDITHGVGLAIITPRWMEFSLNEQTAPKFARYGIKVFNLDAKLPAMEIAKQAIAKTYDFFKSLGVPMSFGELGITDEHFGAMADHMQTHWNPLSSAFKPMTRDDIVTVLKMCL